MSEQTQTPEERREKDRADNLYMRTTLRWFALSILVVVGGINAAGWPFLLQVEDRHFKEGVATLIVIVSSILTLAFGLVMGNASACGQAARRLSGKRWDE